MTHLSNLTRKLQFHEGKLVFTGGKIEALQRGEPGKIAFTKACCCNVPCNRVVLMLTVGISGNTNGGPLEPPDINIPIREGATLFWHYHIMDTVGDDAGRNYHQHNWVVEYCYSDYDLGNDMLAPAESYYNELLNWGCELEKEWINASDCFNTVQYIDDPYCEKTYYDIREEIRDTFDDLTNCSWTDSDEYGPYVESQCPDCICDYSCVDPCPEIEIESVIHARKMYLIEISGDGAGSGTGPDEPSIDDPSYSSYGATTRIIWKAHAYDQFPSSTKGNNYHTHFWAVELCYDTSKTYCTLDGSNGFEAYLEDWACEAEKDWNNSNFCSTSIIEVPEEDNNTAYYNDVLQDKEDSITSITGHTAQSASLQGPDPSGSCGDGDDRQINGGSAFISGDYDEGEI